MAIFQTSSNLISLSNNEVIENDEIKNVISIKKNKRQNIIKKEMNQEKEEEQKFSNTKTKDKTDENRGCRLENLVRMTVKQIYLFVFKNHIQNVKLITLEGKARSHEMKIRRKICRLFHPSLVQWK